MLPAKKKYHFVSTGNIKTDEFVQEFSQGDLICVVGNQRSRVHKIFYRLIKAFSQRGKVGYLVSNIKVV